MRWIENTVKPRVSGANSSIELDFVATERAPAPLPPRARAPPPRAHRSRALQRALHRALHIGRCAREHPGGGPNTAAVGLEGVEPGGDRVQGQRTSQTAGEYCLPLVLH